MSSSLLDPWIEGYLDYMLTVEKKSSGTIRDIRCTLSRADRLLPEISRENQLWKCSYEDFLRYIEKERALDKSVKSISKQLSHIRGMLNYAWRSGRCDRNILDGFSLQDDKDSNVPPNVLSLEDARALIISCRRSTSKERRDRMMIILLYGCGLRTIELRDLNIKDVDMERQELFVRHGKGDKERRIPVPDAVWTELLAYLSGRKWKQGALFRTEKKKKRVSSNEIRTVIRIQSINAGITMKVTPIVLRHSYASHLMDKGVKLEYISSLMGHRSVRETGVYLHALKGKKEQAIKDMKILEGVE